MLRRRQRSYNAVYRTNEATKFPPGHKKKGKFLMKLIPTILCGGAGSRLWPVSRESHPKPFMRLADGQSLLQKAFLRGATQADAAEIFTVTNLSLIHI